MTALGSLPPALPPHGTVLAWARGCRCEECERAHQHLVSELALRGPLRLPAEPEPRKLDADTRARLEPAVSQAECPVCGAPRHQRCRNLAFPQHFAPTHPERGSQVRKDYGQLPPEPDPADLFRGLPGWLAARWGHRQARSASVNVADFPFVVTGPLPPGVDPPQRGNRPRC